MNTWLERAACAEIGGDLFYPVAGSETHYLDLALERGLRA